MRSLIDFIKFNNAVPISLAVLLLGAGAVVAANPAVRETFFPTEAGPIGPPPAAETGTLLATDLASFDMAFRVDSVVDAGESYRIGYSYRTLEVTGTAWQRADKTRRMDIPKELLGKRDLGLYAAEQIGQVMDREIAYLGEVQSQALRPEPETGTASEYAGLVGRSLDADGKHFAGYKPVVKESSAENEAVASENEEALSLDLPGSAAPVIATLSKEEVRRIIVDAVASFLAIDTAPLPPEPILPPAASGPVEPTPEEPLDPQSSEDEASAPADDPALSATEPELPTE
jgi:hypothetical protein